MTDCQIKQIRAQVHKATIAAAYTKMVYTVLRITNRQEQHSKTEFTDRYKLITKRT